MRETRLRILRRKAKALHVPIFYVNLVGGQDELVFDGESLAIDENGRLIGIGRQFQEDLVIVDLDQHPQEIPAPRPEPEASFLESLLRSLSAHSKLKLS
jgi:predicted amidohydrolase